MLPASTFLQRLALYANETYDSQNHPPTSRGRRLLAKAMLAPGWALRNLHTLFSKKHVDLPYLEIMMTQRCNLRCKKCANLMPYFAHPVDVPTEEILEDLTRVLQSVDVIYMLKMLGGEPLLHKGLAEVLRFAAASPKVRHIEIVTNGILLPGEDLLAAMADPKIVVSISAYSRRFAKDPDALTALLDAHGVAHKTPGLDEWWDYGSLAPRHRPRAENEEMFARCPRCVTLVDGEIFCCPRQGNGVSLGLVPKVEGEYVKVRDADAAQVTAGLAGLSGLKSISTCDRCDFPGPPIPMAEQLKPGESVYDEAPAVQGEPC